MDYKQTLNLPSTDFPMKANLARREPEQLARWEQERLYETVRRSSAGRERFILHDGPPYANGHIHMGTALQQDAQGPHREAHGDGRPRRRTSPAGTATACRSSTRSRRSWARRSAASRARRCASTAGLRREVRRHPARRVQAPRRPRRLGAPVPDHELPATRRSSRASCMKFGLSGDLITRQEAHPLVLRCQTALAEAEIEYQDERSASIYVKFPLVDDLSADYPVLAGKQVSVVIWTTTPWTLPANLARRAAPGVHLRRGRSRRRRGLPPRPGPARELHAGLRQSPNTRC